MQNIIPLAGLASRVYLSVFFLAHASECVFPAANAALVNLFPHDVHTGLLWQDLTVAGILFSVAVFLLLGINSRVVGLFGFVLCSTMLMLAHAPNGAAEMLAAISLDRVLALAAVLNLAFTGGGKWCMRSTGWRLEGYI